MLTVSIYSPPPQTELVHESDLELNGETASVAHKKTQVVVTHVHASCARVHTHNTHTHTHKRAHRSSG